MADFLALDCPACGNPGLYREDDAEQPKCPACGVLLTLEVDTAPPLTPAVPEYVPMESPVTPAPVEAITVTPPAPSGFKVPTALKALAVVLVPLLGIVAMLPGIPVLVAGFLGVGALVAAGLLGLSLPMPRFMEGRPLVPLAMVPLLAAASIGLAQLAGMHAPGSKPFVLLYAGACLCALLAGKAAPQVGVSK